jgi:hypothetical protein
LELQVSKFSHVFRTRRRRTLNKTRKDSQIKDKSIAIPALIHSTEVLGGGGAHGATPTVAGE